MDPLRQREPRERDRDHLGKVARLPCISCLIRKGVANHQVQVAHIRCAYPEPGWRHVGKAEKPHDWRTAPLCVACHLDGPHAQHRHSEVEWWADLGVYPPTLCQHLRDDFARGDRGILSLIVLADEARAERRRRLP